MVVWNAVTSLLVGATAYGTFILFQMLWFWIGLDEQRAMNSAFMRKLLFAEIPKATVSITVGAACALVTFAILCYSSGVSRHRIP